MLRLPCKYCLAEEGIENLGISYSGRCGRHYYRSGPPVQESRAPAEPEPPQASLFGEPPAEAE